jgi:hypothetical protein
MISDLIDAKAIKKKLFKRSRFGSGHFSFRDTGWVALHIASIAGIYWLSHQLPKHRW